MFLKLITALLFGCALNLFAAHQVLSLDDPLATALIHLLEKKDATNFVEKVYASPGDWEAEAARFGRQPAKDLKTGTNKSLFAAAEEFLKHGERFGIVQSNAQWKVTHISAMETNRAMREGIHLQNESMQTSPLVLATLLRSGSDISRNGAYAVILEFAEKFPSGWRIANGIKWNKLPPGIVDPLLEADMVLAANLPRRNPDLTQAQDPALKDIGNVLLNFLQKRDLPGLISNHVVTVDLLFKVSHDRIPFRSLPPRSGAHEAFKPFFEKITLSASNILAKADQLSLDFSNAKVSSVVAKQIRTEGKSGIVETFRTREIQFTIETPDGDYVLASNPARRVFGKWYIEELRWVRFPTNTLAKTDLAKLEFDNYVATYKKLPPGTPSPEIKFHSVDGKSMKRLSDYRDKIIILEWWATWCGPCQEPMAKLQELRKLHPDWNKKVEILTLSIDDERETALKHLAAKGWTNTANFWAGGDWTSEPAKAFRVTGVPSFYIIAPGGKIAYSGHPNSNWQRTVDNLLKSPSPLAQ